MIWVKWCDVLRRSGACSELNCEGLRMCGFRSRVQVALLVHGGAQGLRVQSHLHVQ